VEVIELVTVDLLTVVVFFADFFAFAREEFFFYSSATKFEVLAILIYYSSS